MEAPAALNMDAQFVQKLQGHLQEIVSSGDGNRIRLATSALSQQFYSKPECVPALMQVMFSAPSTDLRQVAAVELRKRVAKWWEKVDAQTQEAIKKSLLDFALANEQEDFRVRNAVARVISSIAKLDVPQGKWGDLLQYLYGCCQSQKAAHREVGYYVIYTLLDVVAELFTQHLGQLLVMFQHGLQDPESKEVRKITLKALGGLGELIEPDDEATIKSFRKLVPAMVEVLKQFLSTGDENDITAGIDVFDNLISLDTPLLSKCIPELIEFFLSVGANKSYEDGVRVHALTFLMWAAVYKKNKIMRLKLVHPMVQGLMVVATEEDPEDVDDDSPSRLALRVMHTIAMNVNPQQIFPFVWEHVVNYMNQPSVGHRKAAMLGLATMAEGCSDYIRNEFKVENVIPAVTAGLKDPDAIVRRAACIAIAALANDMGEEVSEYHATILPLVFELLGDSSERIRKVALETLDTLLETLGDKIKPYLHALMEKLVVLLDHADNETKLTITSAIGSAAHAAEGEFRPFFPHVMPRIQAFMALANKGDEDEMALRGAATDAAGAIALAVGKEMFAPYLQPLMELAMAGVHIGEQHLAECSFCLFGIMSKLFGGQEFAPYLPAVIKCLFDSCQVAEKDLGEVDEEDFNVDDEENEHFANYAINNAIAEEKETAVEALGLIFENASAHFGAFLEPMVQIVQELCDHSHEGVRKACVGTFFRMLTTMWTAHHKDMEWSAGVPAGFQVHPDVLRMIQIVMDESMKTYDEEEDKSVVATLNNEIIDALKVTGPFLVSSHMEPLAQHILNLLEKKAPCQAEFDMEEGGPSEEEEEMDAEYDAMVISTTADLIGMLAQAVGESFAPYFKHFWLHISKYYKASRPVSDRSMAVGVLGEVAGGIKKEITPYTNDMMQLVLAALDDEDDEVRSNATYACGMICMYTTVDLSGYTSVWDTSMWRQYPALLMKLSPLFHNQQFVNITDNACGAVSRMILARPEAVPLDQVLPVLFASLPLKKDFAENEPVLACIHGLFHAKNSVLLHHLAQLFPVFAQVLTDGKQAGTLKAKTRDQVVEMIKMMASMDAGMVQTWILALPAEQQQPMVALLQ